MKCLLFLQAPGSGRIYLLCKICRKPCEGRIIFDRVLQASCQWTVSNAVLENHRCGELRKTYYLAIFSAMFLKIFPPCNCFQGKSIWSFLPDYTFFCFLHLCFDSKDTLPYIFEPSCLMKWAMYTTTELAKAKGKEGEKLQELKKTCMWHKVW